MNEESPNEVEQLRCRLAALEREAAALREDAARFRELSENIGDIFWVFDPEAMRMIYTSPAADDIWGPGSLPAMPSMEDWLNSIHPLDRERIRSLDWPDLLKRRYVLEYRIVRPDGSVRWIRDRGFPVLREGWPSRHVAGIAQDITESKAAEERLAVSRDRLELAQQAGGIGTFDWNIRTNEVIWSRQADAIYGVPEGRLGGTYQHWVNALHPEDREWATRRVMQAVESRRDFDAQFRIVWADGSIHWVHSMGRTLCDAAGVPVRMIGVNIDETERVLAHRRLEELRTEAERRAKEAEESRRTLEALMEHIPEGITIADAPDGRIRMVSRYGLQLIGLPPELVLGMPAGLHPERWLHYHADGTTPAQPDQLPLARATRKGEVVAEEEWVLARPDGRKVHVLCNAGPIRDLAGNITGGVVAWRDATERRRLQERLLQAQKLEGIGYLAGGIAHDFNNLLLVVLGGIGLARDAMHANNPAQSHLQRAAAAAERMADLTRQLLAYSGKGRFLLERIEISNLVKQTVGFLRSSIPAHVVLRLNLEESLPCVEGDPNQIRQLVTNLVINGAEAVGEEAGTVLVFTRLDELDEACKHFAGEAVAPGTYVVLGVRDTGAGMDEATKARIFDPFFTTKFLGRGLGLAAAQGIVRAHHGCIRVDSALGQGSVFQIFLPAAREAASQAGGHAA